MELNKEKFRKEIFEKDFDGNYNQCARALDVHVPQMHRILTSDDQAGAKFLGKLKVYCDSHGHIFDEFIILPKPSTAVYGEVVADEQNVSPMPGKSSR